MARREAAGEPTSWRALWLALAAVVAGVVVFDIAFGLAMDAVFARSSANPVARIANAAPDTLIVGSSTAKYSIDPAGLGAEAYNAGENGQSGFFVAALLAALPEATPVRRIVYAFDPDDVIQGLDGSNVPNLRAFAPWAGGDPAFRDWIGHDGLLGGRELVSGLYRYRTLAPRIFLRWLAPRWDTSGFTPLHGSREALPEERPAPGAPRAPSASGLALLDAIAAEVRRRDLELVVVVTPILGRDRVADPAFGPALAAMREAFAGDRFCDLTTVADPRLNAFRETPGNFYDGPHPNETGAARYSAIVADMIAGHCRFGG